MLTRPSFTNVYLVAGIGSFYAGVYAVLDHPPPPIVALFIALGPVIAVGTWFRRYMVRAGRALPYDYGLFLLVGWPVVIPIETLRLHGRQGWRLVGLLFALALAPDLVATLVTLLLTNAS